MNLGIRDGQFLLNHKPVFLLGMSYYSGTGAPDRFVRSDLDQMRRYGFNWIRVWATWAGFNNDVSAVDSAGKPREPFLSRLRNLAHECDRRGMALDVTLSRGNGRNGSPDLPDYQSHSRAVETLVKTLAPYRNWYLDLSNERNIGDARFTSPQDLVQFVKQVKMLDPARLVTASQGGDISQDELRQYLQTIRVDFVTPHRPRDPDSAGKTETMTREYLRWMKVMGRAAPVHYQEPFRRGYGNWQPAAADFIKDLRGAQAGGAAGWCFHNGASNGRPDQQPRRSFDLRAAPLFDQLDDQERLFLQQLNHPGTAQAGSEGRMFW